MLSHDELETYRLWTISTAHISKTDAELLENSNYVNELIVTADRLTSGGVLLAVPPEEDLTDTFLEQLQNSGLSPAIGLILCTAAMHGFHYVKLDPDGPKYDFLPRHYW
jgi:hypothetical protein